MLDSAPGRSVPEAVESDHVSTRVKNNINKLTSQAASTVSGGQGRRSQALGL